MNYEQSSPPKTTLDILGTYKPVQGTELNRLLGSFHDSLSKVASSQELTSQMVEHLHSINPCYKPDIYSSDPDANILAQVVAAIYAPLIHGFAGTILKNIESDNLPSMIFTPPRDAIPIVTSIKALNKNSDLNLINAPVNRKTAGILNSQSKRNSKRSRYFGEMLQQHFGPYLNTSGIVELETGIYSTTSYETIMSLKELGFIGAYMAVKFYGLGPNLSYIHALLSDGKEWVAEKAETNSLVDCYHIAKLMILLDSMEEIGMHNFYKTIPRLTKNEYGRISPRIETVSLREFEIAIATNKAIEYTANLYSDYNFANEISANLLYKIDKMIELSKLGFPFVLTEAIPPMKGPEELFHKIRSTNCFTYPNLQL